MPIARYPSSRYLPSTGYSRRESFAALCDLAVETAAQPVPTPEHQDADLAASKARAHALAAAAKKAVTR